MRKELTTFLKWAQNENDDMKEIPNSLKQKKLQGDNILCEADFCIKK